MLKDNLAFEYHFRVFMCTLSMSLNFLTNYYIRTKVFFTLVHCLKHCWFLESRGCSAEAVFKISHEDLRILPRQSCIPANSHFHQARGLNFEVSDYGTCHHPACCSNHHLQSALPGFALQKNSSIESSVSSVTKNRTVIPCNFLHSW